jgi:CheY-like chemotaxis protein
MTPTILLVEDDANDVFLMKRAFGKAGVPVQLHVARDGREALCYLRGDGQYADRERYPLPVLMLLDLNLPYVPGLEVLRQVREDPSLRGLVIVVLSSSLAEADLVQAYELGANSYLSKPNELEAVQEQVKAIGQYWLQINRFPRVVPLSTHRAMHSPVS